MQNKGMICVDPLQTLTSRLMSVKEKTVKWMKKRPQTQDSWSRLGLSFHLLPLGGALIHSAGPKWNHAENLAHQNFHYKCFLSPLKPSNKEC